MDPNEMMENEPVFEPEVFESEDFAPENFDAVPETEPVPDTTYHGNGAGRKESPFADSPYERAAQPQQPYRYEPYSRGSP